MATRRSFLTSLGLAVLGLAGRGARALPQPATSRDQFVVVRRAARVLFLPRAFVETYRPRIWVRGKGRSE